MEFIRGLHNLRPEHRGCVATIGNFDGVHRGHSAVLGELAEHAGTLRLPALVMVFEPQPQEYFQRSVPARLMRLREKLEALCEYPIDRVLCVRFDAGLAALEPEVFVEQILVKGIGVRHLVIGDDFRFGKDRRGDFGMLVEAGARHGFEVADMPTLMIDGERVSSTRVRAALAKSDLAAAAKLLGRPFQINGRIAHGDKLGRQLGVPTANIRLHRTTIPLHGIYVVEVHGLGSNPLPGVASIGIRPTVGGTLPLLEVHVLDFSRDIYRARVGVTFLKKLRDEIRFDSTEELSRYMRRDIEQTRAFFQSRSAGSKTFRNAL